MAADFIITGDANVSNISSKIHSMARDVISKMADIGRATDGTATNLSRLRYALYDVSSAASSLGNNLIGLSTALVSSSAAFESNFTSVERASQVYRDGAVATAELKQQLLDITRATPISFGDVTQIATLGAQLGVATEDLAGFSLTVAEFSSTTGMSVDSTARAFGSLGELLNLTSDQYVNLGSSIAWAGVNAVATEPEIVAVATAIAGIATQAGLSADYTIGLSTALASLRIPAEQSRGALTRVFQEINRAATIDPNAMDEFANVLGITTAEANKLASTDMETFFNMFIDGMSNVSKSGGNTAITAQLDALGLSDIRVTNVIARLSGNTDLLKKSMSDAGSAFDAGTYLAESFALKVDDLASKFSMLQNALAEFTAGMGDSVAPAVGMAVDFIKMLVQAFADMAKTPAGVILSGLIITVSAVAGAALVAVGAIVTLSASYLAMRVAAQEINKAGTANIGIFGKLTGSLLGVEVGAKKTTGAFFGLSAASRQASMAGGMQNLTLAQQKALFELNAISSAKAAGAQVGFGASLRANFAMIQANIAAMSTLNKVMSAAGWIGLALLAVSLLQAAWDGVASSTKTASEQEKKYAEDAFGSATALSDAMKKDSAMGAQTITLKADVSTNVPLGAASGATEYAGGLDTAVKAQENLGYAVDSTTDKIDVQTAAYGENTKAALRDLLLQSEAFQKTIEQGGAIETLGGNAQDYVNAILGDPVNGAKEYTDKLVAGLKEGGAGIQGELEQFTKGGWFDASQKATAAENVSKAMGISTEEATKLLTALAALDGAQKSVGGEMQASANKASAATTINNAYAQSTGDAADATENAAGKLEEFKNGFDKAFGKSEGLTAFSDSLDTLITKLDENGKAFDQMTSKGADNLSNLRNALYDSVSAAKNLGLNAASGIGMVFVQLQKSGVETATLLSQLQDMGGDYANTANGITTAIAGTYGGLTDAYNAMKDSYTKSSDAANQAAKDFRSAKDVANDFSSVAKRAFEIRFGKQQALDTISEGWRKVADETKRAHDELNSLNADMSQLTADKSLKMYFLSVAEAMGDSIRAAELRAELAKIDNNIASKQDAINESTAAASKTLKGNSAAAIANRNTVRGMVTSYQGYIESLIASGASQATVAAAVAQSRQDFIAQATAVGYSTEELGTYTAAFDDMAKVVSTTDFTTTISIAGLDPALAAIREFKAKADLAAANRSSKITASVDYSALAKWSRGVELMTKITDMQNELNGLPFGLLYESRRNNLKFQLQQMKANLANGNFATGGYTGAGGKYQAAGIVHRGEYVIPREQVNQSTGMPYFMNQPRMFAQGGYAGQASATMVMLSPEDRALLRNIGGSGEVVLYANNEALARSVNAGNKSIVAAGGRP